MSKIGNIALELQELIDELGMNTEVTNLSKAEKQVLKDNLKETIRTNSCEADCPHRQMLGLL